MAINFSPALSRRNFSSSHILGSIFLYLAAIPLPSAGVLFPLFKNVDDLRGALDRRLPYFSASEVEHWSTRSQKLPIARLVFRRLLFGLFVEVMSVAFDNQLDTM